jgi:RHS repeat-associated protein
VTKIGRREYSPFGVELTTDEYASTGRDGAAPLSVFHGKELDPVTSFSLFGARYYSRDLGFWLSADPLLREYINGLPDRGVYQQANLSLYAYAKNQPITYRDPNGLSANIPVNVGSLNSPQTGGSSSNLPSIYRISRPGESFVRYESGNPVYSKIGPKGEVAPGTFAAPSTEGPADINELGILYNLPEPQIPRTQMFRLSPPAGSETWIIGPRPVQGGVGSEVQFPFGAPPGTATLPATTTPSAMPPPPPIEPVLPPLPTVTEPVLPTLGTPVVEPPITPLELFIP